MQQFVALYHQEIDGDFILSDLAQVPEFLKEHITGAFRAPFYFDSDDIQEASAWMKGGSRPLYGAFPLVFMVRRARDILLEPCEYPDLDIHMETGGKRLPQLPSAAETEKNLVANDTLVIINGKAYKPMTEVFGFQQVYDDSVKCIEALKRMGIANEAMSIYATPEEISIEIHPGIFGLAGSEDLDARYFNLLAHVAELKEVDGLLQKTSVKTIVVESLKRDFCQLLPGSNHPSLHRPKVSVGASHFAYGIAAFSDYCGKKRTEQESINECLGWIKFLQTEFPAIESIKEKVLSLPSVSMPGIAGGTKTTRASSGKAAAGRFQSLKSELEASLESLVELPVLTPSLIPSLSKALGGGWVSGGLHIVAGPRGAGKASFLMQHACALPEEVSGLYVSYEQDLGEFCLRGTALNSQVPMTDLQAAQRLEPEKYKAAFTRFKESLKENFYFTANDTGRTEFDCEEIEQLAQMVPGDGLKVVFLESVTEQLLGDQMPDKLARLSEIARDSRLVILMSLHLETSCTKRPHFIEDVDMAMLARFQRFSESFMVMISEKVNLRKFVAMIKGQIDPSLVAKLEQKALAQAKRYKSDTYSLMRLLHARSGRRELTLCLYQPDMTRFFELASLQLNRA